LAMTNSPLYAELFKRGRRFSRTGRRSPPHPSSPSAKTPLDFQPALRPLCSTPSGQLRCFGQSHVNKTALRKFISSYSFKRLLRRPLVCIRRLVVFLPMLARPSSKFSWEDRTVRKPFQALRSPPSSRGLFETNQKKKARFAPPPAAFASVGFRSCCNWRDSLGMFSYGSVSPVPMELTLVRLPARCVC